MKQIQALQKLLAQKEELFDQYEQATLLLLKGPADDMDAHLKRRQELIAMIDGLDGEIDRIAQEMGPLGQTAKDAMRLRCQRDEIDKCLWPLFDRAQGVFAIINRVRNNETLIVDRLEHELEQLTELIKENNRGVSAQVAKYKTLSELDPRTRSQGYAIGKA